MLLGESFPRLDAECRTFYLTGGWLDNWRKIFIDGLKWDAVDARNNFGYFDRMLLLDTGIITVSEGKVLEFFDYTGVPVEIIKIGLENLQQLLDQLTS